MVNLVDILKPQIGMNFSKWKLLKVFKIKSLCRCDCGTVKKVRNYHLVTNQSKSCGCVGRAKTVERSTKHGLRYSTTYKSWQDMKSRVDSPRNTRYKDYGGRGIKYAISWQKFENFFLDMGECPKGYSLERKDVNKGYCKSNCIWIPKRDQALNTRRTRYLEWRGVVNPLQAWAKELKINPRVLQDRYRLGLREDQLFDKKDRRFKKRVRSI